MSAAPKLAPQEQIYIGGMEATPAVRPVVRPAPKRKVALGPILAIGTIWMVAIFLSFTQVQRAGAVREARADIIRMKSEIAELEQRNLELDARAANAVTIAEVERWATSHGMKPPTGVVQTLQGKADAVAVRQPATPAATAPAEEEPQKVSFWASLLARFSAPSAQAASASN